MTRLAALADWVYSLNPYQLTCLTVFVGSALAGVTIVVWFLCITAASGAGETNDGEVEINADDARAFSKQTAAKCRASGFELGNPPFGKEGDQ